MADGAKLGVTETRREAGVGFDEVRKNWAFDHTGRGG